MTPEQMKAWIDNATYEQLLDKWRWACVEDPFFCGDVGNYYVDVMSKRRSQVGDDEHVRASKSIGWDKKE